VPFDLNAPCYLYLALCLFYELASTSPPLLERPGRRIDELLVVAFGIQQNSITKTVEVDTFDLKHLIAALSSDISLV